MAFSFGRIRQLTEAESKNLVQTLREQLRRRKMYARFDGECSECMRPIWEGDEMGFIDGEVCCDLCTEFERETHG